MASDGVQPRRRASRHTRLQAIIRLVDTVYKPYSGLDNCSITASADIRL